MLKKAIIGILGMTLVAGIMLGSDAGSYFRTMKKRASEAVQSEMDLDFEVDRARTMIEDLVPAIEECQEVVIRQQVDLARSEVNVAKQESSLDSRQNEILALRDDLKVPGKQKFRYASISYTRKDVERDLKIRMDRYKGAVAALNRDKKIMVAQRDKLRANQQVLENMVGQKKELEVAVAQLEARLEQLEAEQAINSLAQVDDTVLSRVEAHIQELNNQMDVAERMMSAEGTHAGLIPVGQDTEVQERDIASEVDAYFGGEKAEGDDSAI